MKKTITVKVYEAAGGDSAISTQDGEVIFRRIDAALKQDALVTVDFKNIKLLVSAFLNAAIGQLYGKYSEVDIKGSVKIINLSAEDTLLLSKVVERAKSYFKNRRKVVKNLGEN